MNTHANSPRIFRCCRICRPGCRPLLHYAPDLAESVIAGTHAPLAGEREFSEVVKNTT
jgi:hypothetical protein